MASLPKAALHFLVELVKYQAKQKLGDNALNVLAKSLADYAGDVTEKVTEVYIRRNWQDSSSATRFGCR